MIVVSDTTPVRYLAVLGHLELLPGLFGEVYCPDVVIRECSHPRAPAELREWVTHLPHWIHVVSGIEVEPSLSEELDAGEAAAISLATQLGAQLVLVDDRDGRRSALQRGFVTAGTLNILAQAAARGWVDYQAIIQRLNTETNFWFTQDDVAAAWHATLPTSE